MELHRFLANYFLRFLFRFGRTLGWSPTWKSAAWSGYSITNPFNRNMILLVWFNFQLNKCIPSRYHQIWASERESIHATRDEVQINWKIYQILSHDGRPFILSSRSRSSRESSWVPATVVFFWCASAGYTIYSRGAHHGCAQRTSTTSRTRTAASKYSHFSPACSFSQPCMIEPWVEFGTQCTVLFMDEFRLLYLAGKLRWVSILHRRVANVFASIVTHLVGILRGSVLQESTSNDSVFSSLHEIDKVLEQYCCFCVVISIRSLLVGNAVGVAVATWIRD